MPTDPTLISLDVEAFRVFRNRQTFDVLPLTVLYGRNQVGKSTLVRLLSLLADALASEVGIIDLDGPAFRGSTFKELGWLGPGPISSPRLTLRAPSKAYIELHLASEQGIPFVNRLRIGHKGTETFSVNLDEDRETGSPNALYSGKVDGEPWDGRLTFERLVRITGLPESQRDAVSAVAESLTPVAGAQWLEANRLTDHNSRPARHCMSTGADLARRLIGAPGVVERASNWLGRPDVLGERLAIDEDTRGEPTLYLDAPSRGRLPLSLAGEGARALVPIALCAAWAEVGEGRRPTMLLIEEPESQLHPTLQVKLIDRLIQTVNAGVPVIMDTHSVFMLRALQLAVLRQRLPAADPMEQSLSIEHAIAPEQVGLYWIEREAPTNTDGSAASTPARVVRIPIEKDGRLRDWRPGEMESEDRLAREIIDLRWHLADVDGP